MQPDLVYDCGYAVAAPAYWQAGWRAPLPIPAGRKVAPPTGYTGNAALEPSYADVTCWAETTPDANLCLHLPDGIVGIDVDAYDDKTGASTLVEAELRWGPLPPAPRSTSRQDDPISGIQLFSVPPGTRLQGKIGFPEQHIGDIEIVQAHHRYVLCWPSTHPGGALYQWYAPDGSPGAIPDPGALPPLPAAWVEALREERVTVLDFGSVDINSCLTSGAQSPKVAERLRQALRDLDGGSRHDAVLEHTLALLRYGKQGHPGVYGALLGLREVFVGVITQDGSRTPEEARSEFKRFITNKGASRLLAQPSLNEWTGVADYVGTNGETPLADIPLDALEKLEQDFWTATPVLRLIFTAALSRMTSPWAVLACCTARILCLAPPSCTLPPIIGGPGSLNWFGAIAAKSGGGKGAAMSVAAGLVRAEILVRGIGSGEGMIEAYRRASKPDSVEKPVVAALFSIDEITSLGAMTGRSGQTTMSILKQGFSGETLGYSYRGRQNESVPAHTYRMTLIAGVQPGRAGILFDDLSGGTPQRFMWFPGRDRRITASPPAWPTDRLGEPARIPLLSQLERDRAVGTIEIPDHAANLIRSTRAASMSGDDNAIDGHALFCREKFAYALALMNGDVAITEEYWRLSGVGALVSDWWRAKVFAAYRESEQDQARERGVLRGAENDEKELTEQQAFGKHVVRIADRVVALLTEHGPMTRGALNMRIAHRDRPRLQAGMSLAVESGRIKYADDGKVSLA